LTIYSEIRCANQGLPEHKQWGLFLAAIANEPEILATVEKNMVPPQPAKRNVRNEKAFHEGLSRWAQKHGIFDIEGKVREAVLAGHAKRGIGPNATGRESSSLCIGDAFELGGRYVFHRSKRVFWRIETG
jgi:hypothetical protein